MKPSGHLENHRVTNTPLQNHPGHLIPQPKTTGSPGTPAQNHRVTYIWLEKNRRVRKPPGHLQNSRIDPGHHPGHPAVWPG